eukprot:25031-Amphidinium_carterae.1
MGPCRHAQVLQALCAGQGPCAPSCLPDVCSDSCKVQRFCSCCSLCGEKWVARGVLLVCCSHQVEEPEPSDAIDVAWAKASLLEQSCMIIRMCER